MKIFVWAFILSFLSAVYAFSQETLTITTYYPAPFGVYQELRARRMAIGDNYHLGTYCWPPEACAVANRMGANADLVVEGNVGIGAIQPPNKLYVFDNTLVNPNDPAQFGIADQAGRWDIWAGGNYHIIENNGPGADNYTRTRLYIHGASDRVRIGSAVAPQAKLEVDGGIRIGDDADACVAAKAGTVRYRNNGLQYCNGSTAAWQSTDSLIKGVASMQVAFTLHNREDIVDHEFVEIELSGANPVLTASKRGSISGGWLRGSFINSASRTTVVVPPSMVDTDVRVEYWNVTATPPISVTVLNRTKIRIEVWPRGDLEPSTGAGNRGLAKGSVRFSVLVLQM